MIADRIEAVVIPLAGKSVAVSSGAKFLVEDLKAELLTGFNLLRARSLPQDQIAAFGPNVWCLGQVSYSVAECLP